jgi:hypothetical protein
MAMIVAQLDKRANRHAQDVRKAPDNMPAQME